MAGAPLHRGRRAAQTAIIALTVALPLLALDTTAAGDPAAADRHRLTLPQPVTEVDPLATPQLKLRPDRLRKSSVPGRVNDREDVRVELGPTGAPATVTDTQQLMIRGAGNYIIRELGPAREAVGLGDTVPPVLELGTVVWQGFSPGRRDLSARLTLDPGIEAARLPLSVRLDFTDRAGRTRPLGPGAQAPAAGTVAVTLTNNTTSTRVIRSGRASLRPLARALEALRRAGEHPRPAVPPTGGNGLPASLPGATTGSLSVQVTSPLRVTGTITAPGGSNAVRGPATTLATGGVSIAGTLSSTASFAVRVSAGDRVGLDLDVRPWLDPRTVAPPSPAKTWLQWERSRPGGSAIADATQTLVLAAAASARSAEYSPYLQADAPGPDLSTFTYLVAPPRRLPPVRANMQPRPGAIAAAAVALLAIIGNAALLRRRL
jgi:hypothetical protein